jgi:hypothetical protein
MESIICFLFDKILKIDIDGHEKNLICDSVLFGESLEIYIQSRSKRFFILFL